MTFETLHVDESDGIGRIELARPERRNAMNLRMASELEQALRRMEASAAVRVVLMRGSGGQFCSGGDLMPDPADEPLAGSAASVTHDVLHRVYGRTMLALHHLAKPVVALVEGVAAGAGANLAFACDLVYASADARFCEIFVRRALALDCGGSWLLPRLVGLHRAKELAFFGDWIDAERAEALGLVNAVFPAGEATAEVDARLATLATRPPLALAQIKQSLHRSMSLSLADALEVEATAQAACTASGDFAEGLRAFAEKREPRFEGR